MNWNRVKLWWFGFLTFFGVLVIVDGLNAPMSSLHTFLIWNDVPNYEIMILNILFTGYFGFEFVWAILKMWNSKTKDVVKEL